MTYQADTRATMENAEWAVWNMCRKHGLDSAFISDSGTVDNLIEEGYTLQEIADGEVSEDDFLDNAYPIDGDEL